MAGDFWTWLTTGNHASAVGAVIASAVALVGILRWLLRRRGGATSPTSGAVVKADRGGVAAGRDVTIGERKKP